MKILSFLVPVLVLTILAPGTAAQRTWLVDCAGRPWADFNDLPAAVAAAAPGDTVQLYADYVCSGSFSTVVIDKPLRIVGTSPGGGVGYPAGANVGGRLEIRNIPAGSQVVLSHLWYGVPGLLSGPPFVLPHGIEVRNCAGRVHLDHVGYSGLGHLNGVVLFEDCADVSLDWCSFGGTPSPVTFRRSLAKLTACAMSPAARGPYPYYVVPQTFEGMLIEDSDVTLVGSSVAGASEENFPPQPFMPARQAVTLLSGYLHVGPASRVSGGREPDPYSQPPGGFRSVAAMSTSIPSHVLIDPRAQAGSNNWGIANPVFQYLHAIDHTHITQNETFTLRVMGPPGGFMLLGLSNSMTPGIPTGIGTLGLEPSSLTVVSCGALPAVTGTLSQTMSAWRNLPINQLFAFQAAVLDPGGAISLTLAAPFTVGWMAGRTMP